MTPRIGIAPIPTGKPLSEKQLLRALKTAGDQTLRLMQKDFQKTTRTWNTKVLFTVVPMKPDGDTLEGVTGTDSKIYLYVTRGTRPHIIRPKRAKALAFSSRFRAKTAQGYIRSYKGGRSGKPVFAKEVKHPGTQARGFEEAIAAKHQPIFEKKCADGLQKVLSK